MTATVVVRASIAPMPRDAFTAERLLAFVARFEARTGERAALNRRQSANDASGEATDG